MPNIDVVFAFFYNLYKVGDGGSINIESGVDKLRVINSLFDTSIVTRFGGAIKANPQISELYFSSFINCYSKGGDNTWGNAVYFNRHNARSIIEQNAFYKCGPSKSCGDSSLVSSSVSQVEFHNATFNGGRGGSAGISLRASISGTTLKYMNAIDPYDRTAAECISVLKIESSNFINTTKVAESIFWVEYNNILTLSHCVFIDSHSQFTCYSRSYYIDDCISDKSFSLLPSTEDVQPLIFSHQVKIFSISCKTLKRKCFSYSFYNMLFYNFVYIKG